METTRSFSLTEKQVEVRKLFTLAAVHFLVYGGSRSTKTFLICYVIAVRAMSAPDSRHLIARLHNIDVRQAVMMDTWPKMMRLAFPDVQYDENKQDQFVRFPNGSEVWFGGLDDKERVEKILGKEYATIYINEASQVSYESVITIRTRLAQSCFKVNGEPLALKAFYDLNPVGKGHWTYLEFVLHVRIENGTPLDDPQDYVYAVMNPEDNPHLAEAYLKILRALPLRQRQRFFEGQYVSELPGALWTVELIDALRVSERPKLTRIAVGVDPSGSDGTSGDKQGIVCVGIGEDGHGYVLRDDTCRLSPKGWSAMAVGVYHEELADVIVAEANYGGAMVESTIRTADENVNVKLVTASRGKHVRAEPVSALYEQKKMHHVGRFPDLEEEMTMTTTAGYQGGSSPNRLDGLVWAVTELLVDDSTPNFLKHLRNESASQAADPH